VTQAGENILKLDSYTDPANTKVALLFGYQGIANPLSSDNTMNSGKVGYSVAGAGDINKDGADDILIGAPTSSVNGLGQTYIPIGHPWIIPGQHLNVKDLRSDNGFVLQVPGPPTPVGDVNGDGYDDVVMLGESPERVLGATTMANVNGVRQFPLWHRTLTPPEKSEGEFIEAYWYGGNYHVRILFRGVDQDNDGILRGRGSNPSLIDGGYADELLTWSMTVYYKGAVKATYDWSDKMALPDFNLNYDIKNQQVYATAWGGRKIKGLNLGSKASKQYSMRTPSDYHEICLFYDVPNMGDPVARTQLNDNGFEVYTWPVDPQYTGGGYQVTWKDSGTGGFNCFWSVKGVDANGNATSYKVVFSFNGTDSDGDGILRGRAPNPSSRLKGGYKNELTGYIMEVFKNGLLDKSYILSSQQTYTAFNFNFKLETSQVLASGGLFEANGINTGEPDYNLFSGVSGSIGTATDIQLYSENMQKYYVQAGLSDNLFSHAPGGYKVVIDYDGMDLDNDGILRGRGTDPALVAKGSGGQLFGNELTSYLMRVYQGSDLVFTYTLQQQQLRPDFNFNYDLVKQEMVADSYWDSNAGFNLGTWN
ncbi:MAG: hypothetical protein GY934_20230, partial [Gammaproteobacteria bacterium]|nr:hypothetical protein [Gammaproteobacteria bacterium]